MEKIGNSPPNIHVHILCLNFKESLGQEIPMITDRQVFMENTHKLFCSTVHNAMVFDKTWFNDGSQRHIDYRER